MSETATNRRKRVSFADVANTPVSSVMTVHGLNGDEMKQRWFLPRDFTTFRKNAKQIAKLANRSAINGLLEDSIAPKTSPDCQNIDPLILWCRHAHSRRGLELLVSKEHNNYRCERRKQLIQSVLSTQATLKSEQQCEVTSIEEQLADVSMMLSGDATAFAQRMGRADAEAATTSIEIEHLSPSLRNNSYQHRRPKIGGDGFEQNEISENLRFVTSRQSTYRQSRRKTLFSH